MTPQQTAVLDVIKTSGKASNYEIHMRTPYSLSGIRRTTNELRNAGLVQATWENDIIREQFYSATVQTPTAQ